MTSVRRWRQLGCLSLAAALAFAPAQAQINDDTPVIEAAGFKMTKGEFEALLQGDQRYIAAMKDAGGRKALATDLARAFALEAEARRRQVDLVPTVQLKIRHATQQILGYELSQKIRADYMKDDARLTAHYEANKSFFSQPRVRQILVRTRGSELALRQGARDLSVDEARAKALALHAQLSAGADFAALARAESDDLGSRERGGDMGFILRGASPAKFEAAAYTTPLGRISEVVQTELGFHILRVEERLAPPLNDVRAVLANDLAHRDIETLLSKGFEINQAYFSR
jgi:parvulin-like peptidyl-prolyl isomerase